MAYNKFLAFLVLAFLTINLAQAFDIFAEEYSGICTGIEITSVDNKSIGQLKQEYANESHCDVKNVIFILDKYSSKQLLTNDGQTLSSAGMESGNLLIKICTPQNCPNKNG